MHPGLLQLLEGLSGIDPLMLSCVSDKQHTVLRANLFEEVPHLFRAGEAGFIDHIQVSAVGVVSLVATGKKALQGIG